MKQVHVAAGVIRDADGQVLLARRTDDREQAGLWEFPGGKLEPGETAEQALARELHEELGIEARVGKLLLEIRVPSSDRLLRLDVYQVDGYAGTPSGREGQALAWVPLQALTEYPMPPADMPVVRLLQRRAAEAECRALPDAAG